MIFKYLLIDFLGIFFISCSTKYQSVGFMGGFSETQLSNDIFNVSFKGNGYTSREKVSDFALLRSGELTLNNGYQYFIILNSEKYIDHSSYTSSSRGDTTHYYKPSANNTIKCFKNANSKNKCNFFEVSSKRGLIDNLLILFD